MKKLTALLLALILGLALAAPALDIEAQYDNTKVFTTMLDEMEVPYTITGIDDDKDEGVKIQDYNDLISYTIFCFFSEDNETVSFRIWNFAEYDILNRAQALEAVNNLNTKYKFATWYADESEQVQSADGRDCPQGRRCPGDHAGSAAPPDQHPEGRVSDD